MSELPPNELPPNELPPNELPPSTPNAVTTCIVLLKRDLPVALKSKLYKLQYGVDPLKLESAEVDLGFALAALSDTVHKHTPSYVAETIKGVVKLLPVERLTIKQRSLLAAVKRGLAMYGNNKTALKMCCLGLVQLVNMPLSD